MAWLPLAWLLFVVLAFSVNSASFGIKAAAGPGFISQVEQLVFAGSPEPSRLVAPSGISHPGGDSDPSAQWLAITPSVAAQPLLPPASCYATLLPLTGAYRANYYQQAPRAPPLA